MNILVTGSSGFIGRNLVAWLARQPGVTLLEFDREHPAALLDAHLAIADIVYHLAGVNRPQTETEFQTGNADLTAHICDRLLELGRPVPIVLSSSIQAELDNPYGASKRQAEEAVMRFGRQSGAPVAIYRLHNVFGKWCRPNYNSVVATFCHNISHDLPISISDPARALELVHVDDVVEAFVAESRGLRTEGGEQSTEDRGQKRDENYRPVAPTHKVTLGELAGAIHGFRAMRRSLIIPDLSDDFTRKLYGTYLSYLEPNDFAYDLEKRCDPRGCLAEFIKSPTAGQIFVSRTLPGITRGNHYHHTKTEKFLVLEGDAIIRFRHIENGDVIEYRVKGDDFRVVDIPPGYTHSIENCGDGEMVTLFWSSELFDPTRLDTTGLLVLE